YEERRALSERLERRRALLARREQLREAQSDVEELRVRAHQARQAATMRSVLTAQRRARDSLARAEARLAAAKTAFGPESAAMTHPELDALSNELNERASKLDDLH